MPLPLFPYQEQGAAFLAERARACLFDEMGVGKTATAIGGLDRAGARKILVICPAMLRENWCDEFRKFATRPRRIAKGLSIHELVAWQKDRFDVLVCSYDHATRWVEQIHTHCETLDAVVIDEAHYLKNTDAARTRKLLGPMTDGREGLVMWAERLWLLTGTPMANDPVDIFPFLRVTGALGCTKATFVRTYMNSRPTAYGSRQSPRAEKVGELRAKIDSVSLRRTKKEAGLQLPPIFFTTLTVDGDSTEVLELLREHPGLEEAVVQAIEAGGLSFLDAQHIATLRRLVGEAKAPAYAELLADELAQEPDEKVVVMGIHRKALRGVQDYLARRGIRAVVVNGDTPEVERQAAKRAFQEEPSCRVFLGNIRSAGTGLTLTAAARVDMLESDWAPAGNAQAIMRVHRIGQSRNVRARFIQLAKSIDLAVTAVVTEKTKAIASIEGSAMPAAPLEQGDAA